MLNKTQVSSLHKAGIIALSPSCAEILCSLDLQRYLVGVSRYCDYPPDIKNLPKIGGYIDVNYEKILRLQPTSVVLLSEQADTIFKLRSFGLKVIVLNHLTIDGIIKSISIIGKNYDCEDRANKFISKLNSRLANVSSLTKTFAKKPRVVVCLDRDLSAGQPERMIISGKAGIHNEILTLSGSINAYQGNIGFPEISRENLIKLNPDFIFDIVNMQDWNKIGEANLLKQWSKFSELKAVQNSHVIILHDNKYSIPGPRFIEIVEEFSHIFNKNIK